MEFTQAEAKEKENRRLWVRACNNTLAEQYGIPAGTWGQVIFARRRGRRPGSITKEGWVVDICFYPSYRLVRNISKERYESLLLEVPYPSV
jgi:hypothetical protein